MKPADNLEDSIRQIKYRADDSTRRRILDELSGVLEHIPNHNTDAEHPSVRRPIMRIRIPQFATAAAAMIAVVAGMFFFLSQTARPVYAIEQTIEAMESINAIKIDFGAFPVEPEHQHRNLEITMLALANRDQTESSTIRREFRCDGQVAVIEIYDYNRDETYKYNPSANTVTLQTGNQACYVGSWPGRYFFETIQKKAQERKADLHIYYDTDLETGKECIIMELKYYEETKCWRVQIDPETKLPVWMDQWNTNTEFEGEPDLTVERFIYNPEMPDDLFDFTIPDGAKVIDERDGNSEK